MFWEIHGSRKKYPFFSGIEEIFFGDFQDFVRPYYIGLRWHEDDQYKDW